MSVRVLLIALVLLGGDAGYALRACPSGTETITGTVSLDSRMIGTFDEICAQECAARWCARKRSDGTLVREGPFDSWRGDGSRNAEGTYHEDARQGLWRAWYATGQQRYEGTWVADKKDGPWRFWHENGAVAEEGAFRANEYDGPWVRFYADGKKKMEGSYADGRPTGTWRLWAEDGTLREGEIVGARTGPEPSSAASHDAILIAVYRRQLEHNASAMQRTAGVYCLSLSSAGEEGKDPSPAVMRAFNGRIPPVKVVSQCDVSRDGAYDRETGRRGLVLSVWTVAMINETHASVTGGYWEGTLSASMNVYDLVDDGNGWRVVADHIAGIS